MMIEEGITYQRLLISHDVIEADRLTATITIFTTRSTHSDTIYYT